MSTRRQFLQHAAIGAGSLAVCPRSRADLQPIDPTMNVSDRISQVLAEARRSQFHCPGMVAAVVRGGQLAGSAVDGIRKMGSPEPVKVADQFHIGSCTKAMTATLLGVAVDQGKIGWDSTLASLFPAEAEAMHADYRGVTLDQILHHRAGLPGNVDWKAIPTDRPVTEQRRTLVTTVLRGAPAHPPGTKFLYSNVGYTLAGAMAEAALGASWEDLLRQHVFEPLGMTSAGFGPPGSAAGVDQPWGHRPLGPVFWPTRLDNPPVMGPAGTVHLNIADWAKFAAFHLGDGTTSGGGRVLQAATLAYLHTPRPGETYAGGWNVHPFPPFEGISWTHAGSNTLWLAEIVLVPAHQFAALAVRNGGPVPAQATQDHLLKNLLAIEPLTRP